MFVLGLSGEMNGTGVWFDNKCSDIIALNTESPLDGVNRFSDFWIGSNDRILGSGKFGIVFSATRRSDGKKVAIKLLLPLGESNFAFVPETCISSHIRHPNILPILNIINGFEDPSVDNVAISSHTGNGENLCSMDPKELRAELSCCTAFVYEMMAFDLKKFYRTRTLSVEKGGMDRIVYLREIKHIFFEMLAGLGALHSNSIAHLDIKPCNVMLAPDGTVKIADFSLSRIEDLLAPLTKEAFTHNYRAPEILLGQPYTASATDLWAIGVTILELFMGSEPFSCDYRATMAGVNTKALGLEKLSQDTMVRFKQDSAVLERMFYILGTPSAEDWPETCLPSFKTVEEESVEQVKTPTTERPTFLRRSTKTMEEQKSDILNEIMDKWKIFRTKCLSNQQKKRFPYDEMMKRQIPDEISAEVAYTAGALEECLRHRMQHEIKVCNTTKFTRWTQRKPYDFASRIISVDRESLFDDTTFPRHQSTSDAEIFNNIFDDCLQFLDLIHKILCFIPSKRISIEQALRHPFFHTGANSVNAQKEHFAKDIAEVSNEIYRNRIGDGKEVTLRNDRVTFNILSVLVEGPCKNPEDPLIVSNSCIVSAYASEPPPIRPKESYNQTFNPSMVLQYCEKQENEGNDITGHGSSSSNSNININNNNTFQPISFAQSSSPSFRNKYQKSPRRGKSHFKFNNTRGKYHHERSPTFSPKNSRRGAYKPHQWSEHNKSNFRNKSPHSEDFYVRQEGDKMTVNVKL